MLLVVCVAFLFGLHLGEATKGIDVSQLVYSSDFKCLKDAGYRCVLVSLPEMCQVCIWTSWWNGWVCTTCVFSRAKKFFQSSVGYVMCYGIILVVTNDWSAKGVCSITSNGFHQLILATMLGYTVTEFQDGTWTTTEVTGCHVHAIRKTIRPDLTIKAYKPPITCTHHSITCLVYRLLYFSTWIANGLLIWQVIWRSRSSDEAPQVYTLSANRSLHSENIVFFILEKTCSTKYLCACIVSLE